MARPTKLNKQLQAKLIKALKTGATIADTCQYVGISEAAFYEWMERGKADEAPFAEFVEAVMQARVDAKTVAIQSIRNAMTPYKQTTTTIETFTETKLNRKGEPYEYRRVSERKTVSLMAGDWRASVEYLKRRFPDEWGDRQKIEDWRDQAIADIRAGKISYEALADAFDPSLAAQLFAAAGISVSTGTSATE